MGAIVCSKCFKHFALSLEAEKIGYSSDSICESCGQQDGRKLNKEQLEYLAYVFFVIGSLHKCEYGAAPLMQFNEHIRETEDIYFSEELAADVKIFKDKLHISFFPYGPRLSMVGEIEPLKKILNDNDEQLQIFGDIVKQYPTINLKPSQILYRIRKNPEAEILDNNDFDTPPKELCGKGRLDTKENPILYCSTNLDICLHECRVSAEDELFVAVMNPTKELSLLDLSIILPEPSVTEFDSLDLAVYMLFLASSHSYEFLRKLSRFIKDRGYDGVIYPSYFSCLKQGANFIDTTYGICNRRIDVFQKDESNKIVQNIALFGYPIQENILNIKCISKIHLRKVQYDYSLGVIYEPPEIDDATKKEIQNTLSNPDMDQDSTCNKIQKLLNKNRTRVEAR